MCHDETVESNDCTELLVFNNISRIPQDGFNKWPIMALHKTTVYIHHTLLNSSTSASLLTKWATMGKTAERFCI